MSGYKEITQDEAWDIMEHKTGFQIVDVRTPEEYGEGHIKGAVNIPLETINGREIPELPDRSQELLVYCRSGNRSRPVPAHSTGIRTVAERILGHHRRQVHYAQQRLAYNRHFPRRNITRHPSSELG